MNRAAIQIRVRMKGAAMRRWRPTRATIRQMIQVWIATGDLPPDVRITGTIWGETSRPAEIRRRLGDMLPGLHFGCPGVVKAYARPDTTYCDYDSPKAPPVWDVYQLAQRLGIKPLYIREDRTVRGWHRVVRWNRKFEPFCIVAMQLAMGSDLNREGFNLLRVLSGDARKNKRWNLLFDRKL
jgi:hypothetical protein